MKKPKICIVGPGIVGKATAMVFQEKGFKVGLIGRSQEQIEKLRAEGFTVFGRSDLTKGDYNYDITMLTVPTPTNNGRINLDALELASIDLARRIKNTKNYHVVVVKSTCPPGTTENLVIKTIEEFSGKKVGKDFGACMNPEYLRELTAYEDSLHPWITLIGEYDKKSGDMVQSIYEDFDCPIYRCSLAEAEMQKYVHNLYNAAKITFFNEMREVASSLGINAEKIFSHTALSCEGMWNARYGIKDSGPFSGACLPKDAKAFLNFAKGKGIKLSLLEVVIAINEEIKNLSSAPLIHEKTNGDGKNNLVISHALQREKEQNADYTL